MAHTPDPLKALKGLLSGLSDKIATDLHVSALASIVALTGAQAKVHLLSSETENTATIHNCYILDSIDNLAVGDIVLVTFTDLPLEDFDGTANTYVPSIKRRHSINDGVIVGRLKK